ncbi:unnamed protein product, partial [marine sediment metagenome]
KRSSPLFSNSSSEVQLVDSFEKPEWDNKKALTFRFVAYDVEGTLTKEVIDDIWSHVVDQVTAIGAQVR